MALPHSVITPIPNTEPDAVPALWNVRYEEIDDNFQYLEQGRTTNAAAITSVTNEVVSARNGAASLDARLDAMQSTITAVEPDTLTAMMGELIALRGETGLINRDLSSLGVVDAIGAETIAQRHELALVHHEINHLRRVGHQEGVFELRNRGLIYGAVLTKNTVHARTLDITAGRFFLNGHLFSLQAEVSTTSVAGNPGSTAVTCYTYLQLIDGVARCNTTLPGEAPPDDSVPIYQITIPAGNTEANDPYLTQVALSKIARTEPNWPHLQSAPMFVDVVLPNVMSRADYALDLEAISSQGGPDPELIVSQRASNGFRVYLGGTADRVSVRYLASLMKQ